MSVNLDCSVVFANTFHNASTICKYSSGYSAKEAGEGQPLALIAPRQAWSAIAYGFQAAARFHQARLSSLDRSASREQGACVDALDGRDCSQHL